MIPDVSILADSVNDGTGDRLTTFLLSNFPKCLLAELNTHRMLCLSGDTEIYFDLPNGMSANRSHKRIYKMKISEFYEKWHTGSLRPSPRPRIIDSAKLDPKKLYTTKELGLIAENHYTAFNLLVSKGLPASIKDGRRVILGQDLIDYCTIPRTNFFPQKNKLSKMRIRNLNEETGVFQTTTVSNVWASGLKDVYEVELEGGYKLKCTAQHRIYSESGWVTLEKLGVTLNNGIVSWNKNPPRIGTNGRSVTIHDELDLYKDKAWLSERKHEGLTNGRIAELSNTTEDRVKKSCKKHGLTGFTGVVLTGGRNRVPWNTGKTYKHSPETAKKYHENPNTGRTGSANPSWKGGKDLYKDFNAKTTKFLNEIRKSLLEKCNYTCALTGGKQLLELHHIDPVWHNKSLAFEESNIIPITREAHKSIHSNNLDLAFLEWVQKGKDLKSFFECHNIRFSAKDIGKPTGGKKLACAYRKILNITHAGVEETYDLEVIGPFHNFVANGVVVHNSKNAASSRAMPIAKLIEQVQKSPFIPQWTTHAKGMVGIDDLNDNDRRRATMQWLQVRDEAVSGAQRLADLGIAKQNVNRLLEPWMMVPVIVSGTEWDNFFILRTAPDTQPEFRAFACEMQSLMNASDPKRLSLGAWHIPLNPANLPLKDRIKSSVAACARGSYGNFISDTPDLAKDIALHDRLMVSGHWSPFEHQACCAHSGRYANYRGWESYRFACEL